MTRPLVSRFTFAFCGDVGSQDLNSQRWIIRAANPFGSALTSGWEVVTSYYYRAVLCSLEWFEHLGSDLGIAWPKTK